ncbi:hypothetical protein [Bacillus sonorensis]|uniref:hypothetical protein n=1 Tax=Bacillus sonorensis TaxID=119858 RepID=UPI00228089FE|nr:hypothetical protein [Bacillus sonorensis]MCY8025693.1 hypothetical protein [Bacillus sonorensis]MCY8087633.1 hypothetical protein [Bacillus sonorensis]MCY8271417.1 hypothetical protein [Bacillus sonorensis]MCY8603953.1 hypothetical protein [Bacillus sonorensis]
MKMAVRADRLEIALDSLNYEWSYVQLCKLIDYWYDGKSLYDAADLLKRNPDELLILIVDLAKRRILPHRPYGIGPNARIWISPKMMKEKKNGVRQLFRESPVYISFIENNFLWYDQEIHKFRALWNQGQSIIKMAKIFKREIEEVLFLVIDQGNKEMIRPRNGGLLGEDATENEKRRFQIIV